MSDPLSTALTRVYDLREGDASPREAGKLLQFGLLGSGEKTTNRFITPSTVLLEDGSEKQVIRSQALSLKQLVKELRSYSSDIAESPSEAERQVRAILDEAPEEIQIGVVHPGWKNALSKNPAFVAPDWCRGPRCSSYIWLGNSIAQDAAGTHAEMVAANRHSMPQIDIPFLRPHAHSACPARYAFLPTTCPRAPSSTSTVTPAQEKPLQRGWRQVSSGRPRTYLAGASRHGA